ncbi:MAG: hypothetical protein HYU52_04785 [Acidobacteria bacterium]|nr:hypothetical protein [Acidobacteriota bacterium]
MRSLLLGLSLLMVQLALGSGCASSAIEVSSENPKGPAEISLSTTSDTARVTLGDSRFRIQLRSITDSRCPANAKCIWQGELAAELSVDRERDGKRDSKRFTLGQETMPSLTTLDATFDLLQISETTVELRMTPDTERR